MRGAGSTIDSVMPVSTVIIGGIGTPGFTSVSNRPSSSPPRSLSAPISVIASVLAEPPVVSRSTHDERGLRRAACRGRRATAGAAAPSATRFDRLEAGQHRRERGSGRHGTGSVVEQRSHAHMFDRADGR